MLVSSKADFKKISSFGDSETCFLMCLLFGVVLNCTVSHWKLIQMFSLLLSQIKHPVLETPLRMEQYSFYITANYTTTIVNTGSSSYSKPGGLFA